MFESSCPNGDRNETKTRLPYLQERQINFGRMLSTMRVRVLFDQREAFFQRRGKICIDRDIAQRRLPGAMAHDRQRMAQARMVRAENNAERRNLDAPEHGSGDMSRIHVAGMRCDAADCTY